MIVLMNRTFLWNLHVLINIGNLEVMSSLFIRENLLDYTTQLTKLVCLWTDYITTIATIYNAPLDSIGSRRLLRLTYG